MNDDDLPDLLAWRVPPPAPLDPQSLVTRALTPATAPARRPRLRWLVAALVLANAAIAVLLMIVLARPPRTVVVPAGGPSMDARVHELLARLTEEQAQLEKRVAELAEMRALVQELSDKVAKCEKERTVPKPPGPTPAPLIHDTSDETCDEVSCVLTDYTPTCCAKYKKPVVAPAPPGLPDALDREAISRGVASVKDAVRACETPSTAKGVVKVHVRVGANGLVTNVDVVSTPDAALGACVARGVQRAVFPRTKQGGTFTYPFVF